MASPLRPFRDVDRRRHVEDPDAEAAPPAGEAAAAEGGTPPAVVPATAAAGPTAATVAPRRHTGDVTLTPRRADPPDASPPFRAVTAEVLGRTARAGGPPPAGSGGAAGAAPRAAGAPLPPAPTVSAARPPRRWAALPWPRRRQRAPVEPSGLVRLAASVVIARQSERRRGETDAAAAAAAAASADAAMAAADASAAELLRERAALATVAAAAGRARVRTRERERQREQQREQEREQQWERQRGGEREHEPEREREGEQSAVAPPPAPQTAAAAERSRRGGEVPDDAQADAAERTPPGLPLATGIAPRSLTGGAVSAAAVAMPPAASTATPVESSSSSDTFVTPPSSIHGRARHQAGVPEGTSPTVAARHGSTAEAAAVTNAQSRRVLLASERRLVYPPLLVPVPVRVAAPDAVAIGTRLETLMLGPSVAAAIAHLSVLSLEPPPPPPAVPPRGGRRPGGRTGADALGQRWVLARTTRVPPALMDAPADAAGRSWACPLCRALPFSSPRRLATHLALRHRWWGMYVCGACTGGKELFGSYARVVLHVRAEHGVGVEPDWRTGGSVMERPP